MRKKFFSLTHVYENTNKFLKKWLTTITAKFANTRHSMVASAAHVFASFIKTADHFNSKFVI